MDPDETTTPLARIEVEAGTLQASVRDRIVSGLLLPYGEVGRTNLGRFSVDPGVVTIPDVEDVPIVANLRHERESVAGQLLTATETPSGIVGTIRLARTPEGDRVLADVDRARQGDQTPGLSRLSVELAGVVIRAGRATAGRLFGVGFVEAGAFPSATVLAADTPEPHGNALAGGSGSNVPPAGGTVTTPTTEGTPMDPDETTTPTTTPAATPAATPPAPAPAAPPAGNTPPTGPLPSVFATVANGLPMPAAPAPVTPEGLTLRQVTMLLAAAAERPDLRPELVGMAREAGTLFAALNDVKYDATAGGIGNQTTQPAWLGELWTGREYQRRYVPLFGTAPLTSLRVKGWQWDVAPEMDEWAGNKAAVPSNTPTTKEGGGTARRLAGGHDHAREFVDFPNPEYWAAYFRAMTESYARKSDAGTIATYLAAALARGPVTPGTVPAGLAPGLARIVDGALSIVDFALPTFAVVAKDVWRDVLLTPKDHGLEFLSTALNLEGGQVENFAIVPGPANMTAGSVLVGASGAGTVYELPGSPIRVEGLDMAKGGVDTTLFGYYHPQVNDARGLALVTPAAP